jgi:hypothetical protein
MKEAQRNKAGLVRRHPAVTVLRWLAVLPAAILGGALGSLLVRTWDFFGPSLHRALVDDIGFGGHWIQGPVYVFLRSCLYGGMAVGAVRMVAPSHKRETAFVFCGVWSALILVVIPLGVWVASKEDRAVEGTIRVLMECLPAAVVGFLVAAETPHTTPTAASEVEHKPAPAEPSKLDQFAEERFAALRRGSDEP